MSYSNIKTTITAQEAALNIAKIIDHTLLKPDASIEGLSRLCDEAKEYCFACVCVNPINVSFCAERLRGSGIKVASVVGFPLGANAAEVKAAEAAKAIEDGASELDMVINPGMLKSQNYDLVHEDIRAVVRTSGEYPVKVIIETSLLTDEEKITACKIAKNAGAQFVKTSTGFSKGGATIHDVALMRKVVGKSMGVKASGGIRTFKNTIKMVAAGANRIGTSSGVQIVKESNKRLFLESSV